MDTTGNVIKTGAPVPDESTVCSVLDNLCGEVLQIPPRFSAKNIGGRRAYQFAREGKEFELPPKKVIIHSVKLLKKVDEDSYSFEIECGGGTYIRSIARDMGKMLGTCAVMSSLVRTRSGAFTIDKSVSTDRLTAENIGDFIIATESVLPYGCVYPSESEAKKLFNGLTVESKLPDGIYKIFYTDGSFYGLAEVDRKSVV